MESQVFVIPDTVLNTPYLAGGDTKEDLLKEFDDLTADDIHACLEYAAAMLQKNTIYLAV